MLKRLKLHRFRYIAPGTELVFAEHFNVLLGRNGTGKTTLLDLVSMVSRSDFSALKDEEFDIEYDFSDNRGIAFGFVRFENRVKPPPSPLPAVPMSHGDRSRHSHGDRNRHHPHVQLKLQRENDVLELEVEGSVVRSRQDNDDWKNVDFDDDVYQTPWLQLLSGWIPDELQGQFAYRFDESLQTFESITTSDARWMPKPGLAPRILLDMSADGSLVRARFVPWQYAPELPGPGQPSAKVVLPLDSALAKFPMLTDIKSLSMSLAVERSWEESTGLWWSFGRAEFLFSRARGVVFNHNALSYGQKRLLAFLYYLDANPAFVIADELVNGMHRDWIRACLDQIGNRQSFLTSQNPLLLDYLPLESAEQVRKTFIQCRSETQADSTQILWSNLTEEEAAELFTDYKVGIQPVGEILHARGLW